MQPDLVPVRREEPTPRAAIATRKTKDVDCGGEGDERWRRGRQSLPNCCLTMGNPTLNSCSRLGCSSRPRFLRVQLFRRCDRSSQIETEIVRERSPEFATFSVNARVYMVLGCLLIRCSGDSLIENVSIQSGRTNYRVTSVDSASPAFSVYFMDSVDSLEVVFHLIMTT